MWFSPYALQRLKTFIHESTSIGAYPVRGKSQFSTVPRSCTSCPFTQNIFPRISNLRIPKVVPIMSTVFFLTDNRAVRVQVLGWNSSQSFIFLRATGYSNQVVSAVNVMVVSRTPSEKPASISLLEACNVSLYFDFGLPTTCNFTSASCLSISGQTCKSVIWVAEVFCNSIRPTIPFQSP